MTIKYKDNQQHNHLLIYYQKLYMAEDSSHFILLILLQD
jgi:hypothetical protein